MRLLLLALLMACGTTPEPEQTVPVEPEPTPVEPLADDADLTPVGPVVVSEPSQRGRDFRRMTVDQVSASVERVTGHAWVRIDSAGNAVDRFDELAATLGVPDYHEVVIETRSPSLLFQKFLDDAALDVCPALVADDLARPDGERWLLPQTDVNASWASDAPAIETALQDALLRFHGKVLATDSKAFAEWVFLVRSLEQVSDTPTRRWQAVCTALITHPDFYLY